ncbi:MAG: hypothetical protein AAF721_27905 [Myxococcota bacterium]
MVGCALFACDAGTSDPQDTAATSAGGKADDANAAAASIGVAVTATSIEALKGELGSLEPEVAEFVLGDPVSPPAYLRDMAALGHYGPIGPYGPLGVLGPVGDDVWSPSRFFELAGPWAAFASRLSALDGPLSAVGPLGEDGPLNRERWRDILDDVPGLAPAMADQLEPGGLFAVLGPAGPLGALGPLGPLGPVGAHGYVPNEHGEWIPGDEVDECAHSDERGVCRTAVVPWNGEEQRVYELVEHYDEAFAREKTDNDTSFMVTGALDDDEQDRFEFTSQRTQLVTVLVLSQWTMYDPGTAMGLLASAAGRGYDTPSLVLNFPFPFNLYDHETSFDDFDLTLTVEGAGETRSLRSESGSKVDWVSVVVPKDTKLTATIELHSHWSAPWRVFGPEYRLVVVGATPALSSVRVRGDHQLR